MPGPALDADVTGTALRLARALEAARMPYAIGGAIALAAHGFARATRDVDVNVFCREDELERVLAVLEAAGCTLDRGRVLADAASEGWFTAWDGAVRVDVFVPAIDFSWEAFRSRVQTSLLGETVWTLSAETLCVFKLLFFRTKDLADLEQLLLTSETLNRPQVRETIARLMGEDDERVLAWDRLAARLGPSR